MRRDLLTAGVVLSLAVVFGGNELRAAFIPINGTFPSPTNPFLELEFCPGGDAGGSFATACHVTGGPYDGFQGTIGEDLGGGTFSTADFDFSDIFAFRWLTTADFFAGAEDGFIGLSLHFYPSAADVPGDTDSLLSVINIAGLAAGDYFLHLEALVDPPFNIGALGPLNNPLNIGAIQVVPEPSLLLLAAAGLVASARRARRTKN